MHINVISELENLIDKKSKELEENTNIIKEIKYRETIQNNKICELESELDSKYNELEEIVKLLNIYKSKYEKEIEEKLHIKKEAENLRESLYNDFERVIQDINNVKLIKELKYKVIKKQQTMPLKLPGLNIGDRLKKIREDEYLKR